MSGFGSINDLKNKSASPLSSSSLNVSSAEVEEKIKKKMTEVGFKEKEQETARLATSIGMPHIDLKKFPISQEALRQIPQEIAESKKFVCFYATQDEIRLGVVDPKDKEVAEMAYQMGERSHANVGVYLISERSWHRVMDLYKTMPTVKAITKDIAIKEEDLAKVQVSVTDLSSLQSILGESTTTDSLILILGASLRLEASDVHVEAEEEQISVRFRLDGILHDAAVLPKEVYKKLISRIKLVSSLKINITDMPQDGRFTIKLSSGDVDVRVSTIPTFYGESIVMRLLPQKKEGVSLDALGLSPNDFEILKKEIGRPNGMIITTGPTGSGKTTTLYSIMQTLNEPGVKIITLEDPVEYKMEGINQSQVDYSKDYTFAKGLRSMLRQDPDIAMVGEIRDLETADIAIQAALTGHLILSTIHTNSAAGAIPRFLSMGVKPFLLAPALNCVIGQRLVRRLCQSCKEKIELDAAIKERVNKTITNMPDSAKEIVAKGEMVFYTGKGCEVCHGIGFKGRVGIYEIFNLTPEIEQMILSGQVSEYEIEQIAVAGGMVTMVQDGILKALQGVTAVDEVFRVIE